MFHLQDENLEKLKPSIAIQSHQNAIKVAIIFILQVEKHVGFSFFDPEAEPTKHPTRQKYRFLSSFPAWPKKSRPEVESVCVCVCVFVCVCLYLWFCVCGCVCVCAIGNYFYKIYRNDNTIT